jgi:hypothetical protein
LGNGPGQRGFGFLGGWGDGDVEAHDLELADVGADLPVTVGFSFAPGRLVGKRKAPVVIVVP